MKCVIIALMSLGLVVSCQQVQTTIGNDVAAAEVSLAGVESLAKIYVDLPRCGTAKATTAICSDPKLVARIANLDNTAYGAVKLAKKDAAMLGVAVAAISNLRAAIPTAQK